MRIQVINLPFYVNTICYLVFPFFFPPFLTLVSRSNIGMCVSYRQIVCICFQSSEKGGEATGRDGRRREETGREGRSSTLKNESKLLSVSPSIQLERLITGQANCTNCAEGCGVILQSLFK